MSKLFCDKIVESLNIAKGRTLLVSSDVVGLAFSAASVGEAFNCDDFIESFQTRLGMEGTLLFPAFNFDFCQGKPFDIRHSVSMTGALSKAALGRADFKRTRHPIHSFAVWGKHQKYLCGLNNKSSFGADSPFAFLLSEKAIALIIGLSYQGAFTFAHYAEEMENVPYRYFKEFTAPYVDEGGNSKICSYSMYVRDLEKGVESSLDPIGKVLEAKKIAVSQTLHNVVFRTIRLKEAYEEIISDIRRNAGQKLYKLKS